MRASKGTGIYVVSTLKGPGSGSKVRTTLSVRSPRRTQVTVEFLVRPTAGNLAAIGSRYVDIYKRLWDQDEAMMIRRESVLSRRRGSKHPVPRSKVLGSLAEVRERLPLLVTFGPETFRIIELDGKLTAHGVTCPHWLGPLDQTVIVDGCIKCPWHGYRFEVRTGRSADGHNLSLPRPPRVIVTDERVSLAAQF